MRYETITVTEKSMITDVLANIPKLRELKGDKTISKFAKDMDVEPSTMNRIFNEKKSSLSIITIIRVANYYNIVDIRELIIIK